MYGDGQKPKRALFPQSHGSSASSECHKLPPELNKSASGSQCGEVSMSTQGAEFVRSGGKRLPLWQKTPDTGTKPQAPISATNLLGCWRRVGSRAHQVFWQAPDDSATLDGALFNKAQIIDSFSRGYGHANVEKSGRASAQFGHGERYQHRLCQEGQVPADQRGKFHGGTCTGIFCLWSHQRTSPACGWIFSQPIFLCTLRPESLGHQEA